MPLTVKLEVDAGDGTTPYKAKLTLDEKHMPQVLAALRTLKLASLVGGVDPKLVKQLLPSLVGKVIAKGIERAIKNAPRNVR